MLSSKGWKEEITIIKAVILKLIINLSLSLVIKINNASADEVDVKFTQNI